MKNQNGVVWGCGSRTRRSFPTLEPFHDGDTMVVCLLGGRPYHRNTYPRAIRDAGEQGHRTRASAKRGRATFRTNAELFGFRWMDAAVHRIIKGGTWNPQVVGLETDGGDANRRPCGKTVFPGVVLTTCCTSTVRAGRVQGLYAGCDRPRPLTFAAAPRRRLGDLPSRVCR
jgi:hypothetical protein